jgi:hypothetical protein
METPKNPYCWHCGAAASRQCDYQIAIFIVGYTKQKTPFTSSTVEHPTCDRFLCEACASPPPGLFLCGTDTERLDYCPPHVRAWEQEAFVPLLSEEGIQFLRGRLAQERPKTRLVLVRNSEEI